MGEDVALPAPSARQERRAAREHVYRRPETGQVRGRMRYVLAATLVVAAISFLRPAPAFAQVEEVRIGVDGMTCNLCAAGLERALRKLDAVSNVKVALA